MSLPAAHHDRVPSHGGEFGDLAATTFVVALLDVDRAAALSAPFPLENAAPVRAHDFPAVALPRNSANLWIASHAGMRISR